MSFFIPIHQQCGFRSWYIFILPGWVAKVESWDSLRNSLFSSGLLGTHNQFRNHNTPSSSRKSWLVPSSTFFINFFSSGSSLWCYLILSTTREVTYRVASWYWFVGRITSICRALSSLNNYVLVVSNEATILLGFRLRASATTLALPRWYLISRV